MLICKKKEKIVKKKNCKVKNFVSHLLLEEQFSNYNKVYQDKYSFKPTLYNEGDYVLVRDTRTTPGVNNKLKSKYKKLYLFQKVLVIIDTSFELYRNLI